MSERRAGTGGPDSFRLANFALLATAFLVVVIPANRSDVLAGPGSSITYDDFAFTVLGVETKPAATRGRTLVHVMLRIDNRAKRVGYRFRDDYATLRDATGASYKVDAAAEAALVAATPGGDPTAVAVPAGGSVIKPLAFEVPEGAKGLRLRIRPGAGNAFTDALEYALFGRREFALTSGG